ncbi:MAG: segregation ATPase FtsK/SpoIIIE, family [Sphingomonadales bacterium]|jgi:S-DNA-T family DNA segregation ATPase FtsK/SpoIIIE|nr:segregation ATPase FtsK/SpoIIIE, family [Sphingomonadales bacterium]
MDVLELIGRVAAHRIGDILHRPGTRALFGIMGLSPAITSSIARHLAAIQGVGPIEVFVHPSLKSGDIGQAVVSTRTATWHRNHATQGVRSTIFSVPAAQVRAVEQSLSHIVRIDESWLLERPSDWTAIALSFSLEEIRTSFTRVLEGLLDTELVVTPMIMAAFCTRVAAAMKAGSALDNAIRESLSALRLPCGAGDAKTKLSGDRPASRLFFQKLRAEAQPFLYRQTREGDSIPAGELQRKLDDQATLLAAPVREALVALCDDRNVRDGQWSEAQARVAEISWDVIAPIFAQTKKAEKQTFGDETRRLFDQEFRSTLSDAERKFLDDLKIDGAKAGPEIDAFFEVHRERLRKNPGLYRRWEKLIFKKPIEVADLLEGLLRLADRLSSDADATTGRAVYIWLRGSDQASFWANERLIPQLRYMRDRYRGLANLLTPGIVLDFGRCWTIDWDVDSGDQHSGIQTIEFEGFLVDETEIASIKASKVQSPFARGQMTWRPPTSAIGYSLPADLRRIRPEKEEKAALLTGTVHENRRGRAGASGIDLDAAGSILDAHGLSQGMLANPELESNLVCARFLKALDELEADKVLTADGRAAINDAFEAFRTKYSEAISHMIRGDGLASPSLISQAELFGALIESLTRHSGTESGLRELWAPILEIGVIQIDGRRPAAIVAGWHPLRLAEARAKAVQFADAMKSIASSSAAQRTGAGDFVESRARWLSGTYYADIGLTRDNKPRLLAETQRSLDCSLLEDAEGDGVRNIGEEGAKEAVESLDRISRDYLELRPHERSNFSVVILGAESEEIPVLFAKSLAKLVDDNPDVRCDLIVTHDSPTRLRELYESQNRRMALEAETGLSGEQARNFLSRLRLRMVGPEQLGVGGDSAKGSDLVLLQDVIARSASVRWVQVERSTETVTLEDHVPTARSKRLPFKKRSIESGLYLTAPLQPAAAEIWTHALHDVLEKRVTPPDKPWLPLRWVESIDKSVSQVLERAHSLAHWVVTFDRIADRRLIVQDDRRIIRYFSVPNSSHNVIVSAEVTSSDLGDRLRSDLAALLSGASPAEREQVLKRLHAMAAQLSGAVVMKAAQWHNFAQELIGLVLTQRRLEGLFGADGEHATAWFYLDDNRSWLDLKGELADILAVDFSSGIDGPLIRVVIAEAKYVTAPSISVHKATSLRQLEATFTEMHRRLLEPEASLDPSIWRNKIADMLLEHMEAFDKVGDLNQAEWIEMLRQGSVPIEVSGHSMIFSYDLGGTHSATPIIPDEGLPAAERRAIAQWVHGRTEVIDLLNGLAAGAAPPMLPIPSDWLAGGGGASPGDPAGGIQPEADTPRNGGGGGAAAGDEHGAADEGMATGAAGSSVEADRPGPGEPDETDPVDATKNAPGDGANKEVGADAASSERVSGWRTPVAAALARMSHAESEAAGQMWLAQKVEDLRNALQAEGMDAPIQESRLTPNSGLVYIGARMLTVNWLERRQTDLLTKHSIDIVRISPMAGRIAVAIRRPVRSILHLADAWLRRDMAQELDIAQNFAPLIGEKEDDGALLYLPLAGDFGGQERAAPHSLISGNTGSGKGILVTNLMLDLCALNSPDEIELHLIDPKKGVDYGWATRLPHLSGGIVTDQKDAIDLLDRLVADMEARYELISSLGYRNIDQYNRRVDPADRMRRVVIFFDEVANWMQDDDFKKEVESLLNKIATKARAAGLHLLMVYQRADVQVMTMQLRTNLGNRLILRLPDEGSSKIALGEKGADKLLGKGHLIAKLDNDEKIYAQVPFIDEDEVEELADAIGASWAGGHGRP